MRSINACRTALTNVGFKILLEEDLAARPESVKSLPLDFLADFWLLQRNFLVLPSRRRSPKVSDALGRRDVLENDDVWENRYPNRRQGIRVGRIGAKGYARCWRGPQDCRRCSCRWRKREAVHSNDGQSIFSNFLRFFAHSFVFRSSLCARSPPHKSRRVCARLDLNYNAILQQMQQIRLARSANLYSNVTSFQQRRPLSESTSKQDLEKEIVIRSGLVSKNGSESNEPTVELLRCLRDQVSKRSKEQQTNGLQY